MTVSSEISEVSYDTDGVTTSFPVPFYFLANDHLRVWLFYEDTGAEVDLVLGSTFLVTGAGNPAGGTVTTSTAYPAGPKLRIERVVPITQETAYQRNDPFPERAHERALDKLTMICQQLAGFFGLLPGSTLRALLLGRNDVDGQGAYRARNNRIQDLADPKANQDAVNRRSMFSFVTDYVDKAIAGVVGGFGWFLQAGMGAIFRTFQDKMRDTVSVKDFGAKGDAVTDDRDAIIAADAAAAAAGKTVWFPAGVYRSSDGIEKMAKWRGEGAPVIGVFPVIDDKRFLRPGQKNLIPGTSLLFTGSGTLTKATPRSDMFSSFTYCVRDVDRGSSMEGMAIILDCDVYDAGGNLTLPADDNRASYDVGRFIDDASQCYSRDVAVFGYFPKAGTVVYSQIGNDDPDYNIFDECSTMGKYGLALIGGDTATPIPNGLSGTQGYGFDIWSMDHHSRAPDNAAAQYAGADAWRCLYIDVNTTVSTKGNGHAFYGGCIRTYADHPLGLDHCNNVRFYGTVFEETSWGVTGSTTTTHLATVSTTDVSFIDTRHSKDSLFHAGFAGAMTGQLIAIGSPLNASAGMVVSVRDPANNGQFNWTRVSADGISGDPYIQLGTGSVASANTGWSMRRDIDASNIFDLRYNATSVAQLSTAGLWVPEVDNAKKMRHQRAGAAISSGAIAFSRTWAIVTTGTGSGGTLHTITGGTQGDEIIITAGLTAEPITIDTAAGNIRIGANTVVSGFVNLCLVYNGSFWVRKSG
jgi:hypothetical protein